jgi:membrane protease YdiL (CAAX protease family)
VKEPNPTVEIPQYSLGKIILIWVAAAAPMGILGWVVAPPLAQGSSSPGTVRLAILAIGLVWQFALVMLLLAREGSALRWSEIKQRLWLLKPSADEGASPRGRLWWWIVPAFLLTALFELQVGGAIDQLWVGLFPRFAEPTSFSMAGFLESPQARAGLVGAWGFLLLYVVQAIFNTVIGEELLFRGLLLPRMAGAFGKWDWVANGVLFGFYHWHQPWVMLSAAIEGALLFAYPTRRFKSAWFGIIAHSGQSFYFALLLVGLVLGLA